MFSKKTVESRIRRTCAPGGSRGRRLAATALAPLIAAAAVAAHAHDFRLGDLVIDHPYAVPSDAAGQATNAYLRGLRNTGAQDDRLLGASSPVARTTTLQCVPAGGGAPADTTLPLPAGATVALRHDGACALHLEGLRQPLKVGDHLPLTLKFERAGEIEVHVDVQQPRARPVAS